MSEKSKIRHVRHYEFIGDGFLNYYVKRLMTERYPETAMFAYSEIFGKIIKNDTLRAFGNKYGYGSANNVEIRIGRFVTDGQFRDAEKLVEQIFNYVVNKSDGVHDKFLKRHTEAPRSSLKLTGNKVYKLATIEVYEPLPLILDNINNSGNITT